MPFSLEVSSDFANSIMQMCDKWINFMHYFCLMDSHTHLYLTFLNTCLISFYLKDTEVYLWLNSKCYLKQRNHFPLNKYFFPLAN